MKPPIAMRHLGGHHMQVWYDEHRFQVYRHWRRKQGLPADDVPKRFITYVDLARRGQLIDAADIVNVQPMIQNANKAVTP